MIEAKLLSVQGQAAIVSFRDKDGIFQARIISVDDIAGLRIGETKSVSKKLLDSGTEYGIDWETLLGDEYDITPVDISNELRKHGLWTYDDMNKNPHQVTAALNALSYRVFAELMRRARELR